MIQTEVIIYNRVSHVSQDYTRQVNSLKETAAKKNWNVKRVFSEKISGTTEIESRKELMKAIDYAKSNNISIIATSELSRLGRKVLSILQVVDILHKNGIGVYIQQFDMTSLVDGKENHAMTVLLQAVAIGSELEIKTKKERQKQGIELAKLKGVYKGRKPHSKADPEKLLFKYADVVELLNKSDLSLRRIAKHTGRSVNTVRKVKEMVVS